MGGGVRARSDGDEGEKVDLPLVKATLRISISSSAVISPSGPQTFSKALFSAATWLSLIGSGSIAP